MLKNYFKIAWRNLIRDKQFSLLNLAGLSIGLACALLIYLWVGHELSFDKFHEKDSQLFQVMKNRTEADGMIETDEATPGLLANMLAEEMPEVEKAVSVIQASWFSDKGIISVDDKYIKAAPQFIGKDYFDMFSCNFVSGSEKQFLSDKQAISISDELALKLFNSTTTCIGKIIKWDQGKFSGQYHVAGVFEEPPANSSSSFDILFNYAVFFDLSPGMQHWENSDPNTYVLLKEGTDIAEFNAKIAGVIKSKSKNSKNVLFARKYSDQYLHGRYENGIQTGGRIEYVRLFSIIAVFILLIACINFMNLSTAKASRRMKEIGVKKVVGASRKALVLQHMGESMLMAFLSLAIAFGLVWLLLPMFNDITGKELTLEFKASLILPVLTITIITGIISGSYPALYLSGFKPAIVLKGKLHTSAGELWVRKGLVVFQFAISAILIVAVLVVYQQMQFIQNRNLGYNRNNIISFKRDGQLKQNFQPFLSDIKKIPGVTGASSFSHNLTGDHGGTSSVDWEGKDTEKGIEFGNLEVDYGLMELVNFKMVAGRTFSEAFGSDSSSIIFNEAAIAAMGLKNPIGKTIKLWGKEKRIIGVVKNFHFESLYEEVKPCFLQCSPNKRNILVKIEPGTEKATIESISKIYTAYNPGIPFDFKFSDDDYQAMYASEKRVAVLSRYFAGLAIVISCLGLFGLAAFTAQKRQKEIGIRKVMGASARTVAVLLSRDFLKLIAVAILIAFPVAWLMMNEWLSDFAYRIDIGAGLFVVAGICTLFLTLLTISFQAIKAAIANPIKSLRTE